MRRIEVSSGDVLSEAGQSSQNIYFPENAVVSLCVVDRKNSGFEVAMAGREGMIGVSALLGARLSPHRTVVQISGGSALVAKSDVVKALAEQDDELRNLLLRYTLYLKEQMARTILSERRDQVEARLARRLLMLHDRIEGDELSVTHADLGDVLNVRRATVTDCLHLLEGEHILHCTRGRVAIRNRAGLERAAGDSYGSPEATYRELIYPFGKTRVS
ncbi:Crp/Fnr family transcriptional regulator [Stakelama marina]|uniref:Crp/Fnr family transcriptional regulator n=1 Tax=Stakelama marina TaxID=2826939 RepID=A0A8T4IDB1_9SPHN|nr:Crp/Fnr family transcriptional regulator [Stakelama marina]MBR0551854.1 Crp/Fnr family transcriptional regulator [Stakelama marina]